MEEAQFTAEDLSDNADEVSRNTISSSVDPKILDPPDSSADKATVEELSLPSTQVLNSDGKSTPRKEAQEISRSPCNIEMDSTCVNALQPVNETSSSDVQQKLISDEDKEVQGADIEETEQYLNQNKATPNDDGTVEKVLIHSKDKSCSDDVKDNKQTEGQDGIWKKFDDINHDVPISEECSSPQREIAITSVQSVDEVTTLGADPIPNNSHSLKENSSSNKKRERSPHKGIYDKEHESIEENVVTQRKRLKTPVKHEQLQKLSSDHSKLLQKQVDMRGIKRKVGRPPKTDKNMPKLTKFDETINKDSMSTVTDNSIEKKSDKTQATQKVKRINQMVDEENLSLFLPEDWYFIGSVRQAGINAGHIDLYYITPPPRVKLRSRQELISYMQTHGLNYDPLQFFIRRHIGPLLKKGILKYHDPRTVVLASCDEAVISQLIPNRQTKATGSGIEKEKKGRGPASSLKYTNFTAKNQSFQRRKYITARQWNGLSLLSFPKVERQAPVLEPQIASPKATAKKIRQNGMSAGMSRAFSPEFANKQMRKGTLSTPTVNEELASPESAARKLRGRNLTAASPKLPAASPETANKETREECISAPPKKPRGRPKRSVVTLTSDGASPPRSNLTLEERVKIHSKPKTVRSPYFSSSKEIPKSLVGFRKEKKTSYVAPPRSPFNLIQEDLFHNPWQMLIATIFLNSTSGRVAIPLALEFLKRWPTPQQACQAQLYDILDVIEPLGFGRTRAAIIIRFSHEFLTKDWKLPSELYGISKYGTDSYKIFCMKHAWKRVESDDPMLMMYLNWRRATEHLRKRFMNCDSSSIDPDDTLSNPKPPSTSKDKCSPSPRASRTRMATK